RSGDRVGSGVRGHDRAATNDRAPASSRAATAAQADRRRLRRGRARDGRALPGGGDRRRHARGPRSAPASGAVAGDRPGHDPRRGRRRHRDGGRDGQVAGPPRTGGRAQASALAGGRAVSDPQKRIHTLLTDRAIAGLTDRELEELDALLHGEAIDPSYELAAAAIELSLLGHVEPLPGELEAVIVEQADRYWG